MLTSGAKLNLGNIKGADGTNGKDGTNGSDGKDGIGITKTTINSVGELVIQYSDGTSANLGTVVGADGKNGKDGTNGTDGKNGKDGTNGKDAIGVAKSEINADGELVVTYSDGTSTNLGVVIGKDGENGADGINGKDGKDGANGADGQDGKDGIGISDVVINSNGELELTFSDLSNINLGCIVGKDGQDGKDGTNCKNVVDGKDGANGTDGKDGVGISNVSVSDAGVLTVELTNGTNLELGNIKGADGIGITKSEVNSDGELVLTYTNGQSTNLGKVAGKAAFKSFVVVKIICEILAVPVISFFSNISDSNSRVASSKASFVFASTVIAPRTPFVTIIFLLRYTNLWQAFRLCLQV